MVPIKLTFSFLIVFIFLTNCTTAQWQPDVRLTNDPAVSNTSTNNAWCVASSGNSVHVVWQDNRDGNAKNEIYYKHSTDGGLSWEADKRLTFRDSSTLAPCVSLFGSMVHVVWYDNNDGNYEIYYIRSSDGGMSWGATTRLTNNTAVSHFPSVTVSGQVVHVVWSDLRDLDPEIYYKRSTDGGINWEADTRLTSYPLTSWYPSVSASGSVVHVVWSDSRDGGNWEIYYKCSIDGGSNWQPDTRLTNNSAVSIEPSVAVSGSVVNVVWRDDRDGNYEIYYKHSTDGGTSWGADTRQTNNSAISQSPSIAVSGSTVHIVWLDNRDGNNEIYYKRSLDGGESWETDTRLTYNSANSYFPSLAVSGSSVHVLWQDARDGNWEIYYKRDPTGNPTGIININSEVPKQFSLSENYPNPFNPSTKLRFQIAKLSDTRVTIFDAMGRKLETLVNERLQPGIFEVDWNASNYSSGIYFCKLTAGDYIETKKMILLK